MKFIDDFVELLKEHNLFDDSERGIEALDELNDLLGEDDDMDERSMAEIALGLLLNEEIQVNYAFDIGGWTQGDIVGLYSSTVTDFNSASKGVFQIENLKTINPLNDDPLNDMTIEFKHDNKHHKWHFIMNHADTYFHDLTQLVNKSLDGNVLFLGEEAFNAYCVPKEFIEDLEKYGVKSKPNHFLRASGRGRWWKF